MKIRIEQENLQESIQIAQKAISSRTTMQALECIHFQAKEEKLILSASDLEISIITETPCHVDEEGVFMLPSNLIGNISRKLPRSMVSLEEKGDKINLKCERSVFNLSGADPSEFPELPKLEKESSVIFKNEDLIRAIRETIFAVSTDEMRLALTGILLEAGEDGVRFVALDGYRLATKMIRGVKNKDEKIIIPQRALQELLRIIDQEGETKMSLVPGYVIFDLGDTVLYSRLIDKNYLNYKDILNQNSKYQLYVDKNAIQNSIERAQLLSQGERANLIKLNISKEQMTIRSNTEIGDVEEVVFIDYEGDDINIAFNARYLLDGIKNIDSEKIKMEFSGSLDPCLMHPQENEEDYTYLVLPVRLAKEN